MVVMSVVQLAELLVDQKVVKMVVLKDETLETTSILLATYYLLEKTNRFGLKELWCC